ncbi:MAG TPA: hypothetical protein VKV39_19325 [Candidatus Sulfotelmatobacter sp.]|nr:hypothetical protein [Candidatus Sulfotelmatobacter sp.]
MRPLSRISLLTLMFAGAAFAQSASGDSLGDIARANRAQQQAQQTSGATPKVITNQDLPSDPPGVPEESLDDPMTMVSGVKHSDRAADQRLSNRLQAEQRNGSLWKARIEDQENRIADLQARIDRVNASMHAYVGTAQYDTPVGRYHTIQMERLAMMQQALDQQKRRLASMQDAARRAGMDQ